jgi:hypothetical protein
MSAELHFPAWQRPCSFFKSHKRRSSAKQHTVEVMPWPALSPYLDPIEHLRDEIQSRRNEIQPRQADNCSWTWCILLVGCLAFINRLIHSMFRGSSQICCCNQCQWRTYQGRIQDFKLGGTLKKIAPSEGRRENCWGISCEKSRFYAKNHIFSNFRGGRAGCPTPLEPPLHTRYRLSFLITPKSVMYSIQKCSKTTF